MLLILSLSLTLWLWTNQVQQDEPELWSIKIN